MKAFAIFSFVQVFHAGHVLDHFFALDEAEIDFTQFIQLFQNHYQLIVLVGLHVVLLAPLTLIRTPLLNRQRKARGAWEENIAWWLTHHFIRSSNSLKLSIKIARTQFLEQLEERAAEAPHVLGAVVLFLD